jgi:DNA (cytosine-5)-methyltransferase 1
MALGLHRAGLRVVAHCEVAPYASRVLEKRFPGTPNIGDVTKADFPDADVIAAGWPCQDLSNAGNRAGLAGERSGLWREVVRAIRLVRPVYVVLENVAALRNRGMGTVLGDLASLGLDAEWDCIPASHVGFPHNRDRAWIVAHAQRGERWTQSYRGALGRMGRQLQPLQGYRDWQDALRQLRGMDDGTAYRVDRVDTIRNALVPQIPEAIGRAILAAEADGASAGSTKVRHHP